MDEELFNINISNYTRLLSIPSYSPDPRFLRKLGVVARYIEDGDITKLNRNYSEFEEHLSREMSQASPPHQRVLIDYCLACFNFSLLKGEPMTVLNFRGYLQFDHAYHLTDKDNTYTRRVGLLRSAAFLLCRIKEDRLLRQNNLPPKVVTEAYKMIDEMIYEKVTQKSVASALGLSPEYLSHLLKTSINKTTTQLIQELKIAEAKSLLSTSTTSVQEIGNMLGYTDISHFSRRFKNLTGQTPSQYRRDNQALWS